MEAAKTKLQRIFNLTKLEQDVLDETKAKALLDYIEAYGYSKTTKEGRDSSGNHYFELVNGDNQYLEIYFNVIEDEVCLIEYPSAKSSIVESKTALKAGERFDYIITREGIRAVHSLNDFRTVNYYDKKNLHKIIFRVFGTSLPQNLESIANTDLSNEPDIFLRIDKIKKYARKIRESHKLTGKDPLNMEGQDQINNKSLLIDLYIKQYKHKPSKDYLEQLDLLLKVLSSQGYNIPKDAKFTYSNILYIDIDAFIVLNEDKILFKDDGTERWAGKNNVFYGEPAKYTSIDLGSGEIILTDSNNYLIFVAGESNSQIKIFTKSSFKTIYKNLNENTPTNPLIRNRLIEVLSKMTPDELYDPTGELLKSERILTALTYHNQLRALYKSKPNSLIEQ